MFRKQIVKLGDIALQKEDERGEGEPVLYFQSGKKLYVVGAQSGDYPPLGWRRTGFVVGKRVEEQRVRAAHLVNEMGGIWAQPIKVLDGFYYSIQEDGREETWELRDSDEFVNFFSHVRFVFVRDNLRVDREDFVVDNQPALFSTVRIRNGSDKSLAFTFRLRAVVNIMPAWFAGMPDGRDEVDYYVENGTIAAYDRRWPERWSLVFGSPMVPVDHDLAESNGKRTAILAYHIDLAPGREVSLPFLFAAENQTGLKGAQRRYATLLGRQQLELRRKTREYERTILGGPQFECSDRELRNAFYIAKANLRQLQADLPAPLGQYFYAGIPEYVQLFGTDTCYSVPGLVATGFAKPAREVLGLLRRYADQLCGRIPHEITTTGRVFHPGSPQETPQFAIACWNYFRWTADRPFLESVYPLCAEALLDYVVAHWDSDLDFYPDGQSMIERRGADEENVDSLCYFCKALECLSDMAEALGDHDNARRYRDQYADVLRVSMNQDFWISEASIFADALTANHTPKLDGYWTVVVPLETELADADKAERAIATIVEQEGWLARENGAVIGLVHTRGGEPTVWTLPTGILARVALAWGRTELGVELLRSIGGTAISTLKHGALGTFEELIPEGLSFVQLWSPAMFVQGIIEGVFGVNPKAHLDCLEVFLNPPNGWSYGSLKGLQIGGRELGLFWDGTDGDELRISQKNGARLSYSVKRIVARGSVVARASKAVATAWEKKGALDVMRLGFTLEPGEEISIRLEAEADMSA